jgi:hypothetical protein
VTGVVLTGDSFTTRVVQHEAAREQERVDAEHRRQEDTIHAATIAIWKEENAERKARNAGGVAAYKLAKVAWEEERERARRESRPVRIKMPKRGPLESFIPAPKHLHGETQNQDRQDEEKEGVEGAK